MRKLYIILFFLIAAAGAKGQTIWVQNTNVCCGDTFYLNIPGTLLGTFGSASIHILYDSTRFSFKSGAMLPLANPYYSDLQVNPLIGTASQAVINTYPATGGNKKLSLGWFNVSQNYNVVNEWLFKVRFICICNPYSATPAVFSFTTGYYGDNSEITDINGNVITTTYTAGSVTQLPLPAAAGIITGPATVCQNTYQTYSVPAIANVSPPDYHWAVPTGATIISGQGTTSIQVHFTSTTTTPPISVYGSNSCDNGASSTKAVVINQAPIPNYPGQSVVSGNQATLNGTVTPAGTYTYVWAPAAKLSTPSTGATPTTTFLTTPQTYTCTVTNSVTGCDSVFAVIVNVTGIPLAITATSASPTATCLGGTINLSVTAQGGTGSYTYAWSSNPVANAGMSNTTTVTPTSTPTVAGSYIYTVTVTDAVSLLTVTQTLAAVTIYPNPSGSISSQTNVSCFGNSTGTVTIAGSSGTAPFQYSIDGGTTYQASGTFNNLAVGPYSVTIKDIHNCTVTVPVTITQPAAALSSSITAGPVNVLCFGLATGSVTVAGAGGTTAYQYSINGGTTYQASGTFSGLSAGSYTVIVKDAKACTVNQAVIITQPLAALAASISAQTNVNCFGNNTGSATVTATDGTGPYTYSWNTAPVQTTATASNLIAGIYSVTVTDNNLCATTAPVTITQPAATLVASIAESDGSGTANDGIICPGGNSTLTANYTGGTGPVTYVWDNGLSAIGTQTVSPATTTVYHVTITDSKGCTSTASSTVTANPALIVNITETDVSGTINDNMLCQGGTANLLASATGGTVAYTYNWNNGLGTGASKSVSPISTTNYSVTVTDQVGCIASTSTNVAVNPALTLTLTESDNSGLVDDGIVCSGGSANLAASGSGGTTAYVFSWNNGLLNGANQTVSPAITTTYNVTITDANGCTQTASKTITVNPALSVTIGEVDASGTPNDSKICFGGSADLTATKTGGTNPVTYLWDNSLGSGATHTVNPAVTTTYNVTVTDQNGCTATASKTITVNPILTAAIAETDNSGTANDNIVCSGGTANLSASGSGGTNTYTYLWSGGLGTNPAITVNPALTTIYTVTVTDGFGCSAIATLTITVNTLLTSTVTETDASGIVNDKTICPGDNASITVVPTGGTLAYAYTWSPNIGSSAGPNVVNPASTTTYVVTTTDSKGCQSTSSVTITVGATPVANCPAPSTVNYGTPTTLTGSASGGTGPYAYSWTPLASISSGATTTTASTIPLNSPTTFCLVVTDNFTGCKSSSCCVLISIQGGPPAVGPTAVASTICFGDQTQLFTNPSGGNPPGYTYTWSSVPGSFSSTLANPFVSPTVTTTYTVVLHDATANPPATGTVTVIVNPLAIANANIDQAICQGTSVSLNGNASGGATTGTWTDGGIGGTFSPNATTLNASYAPPPAYNGPITLTLTTNDPAGPCSFTSDAMLLTVYPAISGSIVVTDNSGTSNDYIVCPGGSATLTASGASGLAPYSYNWSGSMGTTASVTVTPATTSAYTVTVTDSHNCSTTSSATVTVNQPLSATNAETDISGIADDKILCPGGTANMTATGVGGVAPYSYLWNNGLGTGPSKSPSPAITTIYSVTATDANGCTGVTSVTITVNPVLVPSITETDASGLPNDNIICPGGSATLTASSSGGAAPYSFTWSSGIGTGAVKTVNPAVTTTYTVTVTDASGCTGTANFIINVNSVINPSIAETDISGTANDNIICPGGSATITASATGGLGPYVYTWSNGIGTGSSKTVNPAITTTYTVSATDANGCSNTANVTVTVNPAITASIAETDISGAADDKIICPGGTANLTVSGAGGIAPYNYLWSNALGTGPTKSPSPVSTTTYSVTVTDANGCTGLTTVMITVNPVLVPSIAETDNSGIANDHIICPGGSATITASSTGGTAPYVFSWSNGLGLGATKTVNPLSTLTYTVTVTDVNGCSGSTTVTINVNPAITVSITESDVSGNPNDNIICTGGTATILANATGGLAPFVYTWDNGLGTGASKSPTPAITTTYTVTATDASGCVNTASVTVSVNPAVIVNITESDNSGNANDNIICPGGSATLTAAGSGGTSPYVYAWSSGGTGATKTVNPAVTTIYTVTVTDVNGCTSTKNITITVNPVITPSIVETDASGLTNDNIICPGGSATLTASATGGASPYVYSWSGGIGTGAVKTVNPASTTTYTVTVTDANGCTATTTKTITVNPALTVSITETDNSGTPNDNIICQAGTATMTAAGSGGTAPYVYLWSGGIGTGPSKSVLPLSTTTYTVTATDANGCTSTFNITINVNPVLTVGIVETDASGVINDNIICPGGSATLTATGVGGTAPYIYAWSGGGTGSTKTVTPAVTTTYTVTVTDANGCTGLTTKVVTVNPALSVTITETDASGTTNDNTICPGGSATILAAGIGGTAPYVFTWSGPLGTGASKTVNPATTTTYLVTVTDVNGCAGTNSITINVNPAITPSIAETDNSGTANDNIVCTGGSATLTASALGGTSPYSYNWSSGGTGAVKTYSPAVTTTYTVTVTDAKGCVATTSLIITVNPAITTTITETDISGIVNDKVVCLGDIANITAVPAGGTTPYTYVWSPNIGTSAGPNIVSPLVTTNYLVTVTDNKGCKANTSVTITIGAIPVANCGNTASVNYGLPATLAGSASGGIGPYSYTWTSNPAGFTSTLQNPVTPGLLVPTTFTLVVKDNTTGCQSLPCNVLINIIGGPLAVTPSANPSTICIGSSSTINANPSGGDPPTYAFSWTSVPAGFTSTSQTPTVNPTVTTVYTVNIQDNFNTAATNSVTVTVNPVATANAGLDATICQGTTYTLSGVIGGGAVSGSWSDGVIGGTFTPSNATLNAIYTPPATYNGNVTLTLTSEDPAGPCPSVNDVMILTVNSIAITNAGPDQITCQGTTVVLAGSISGSATSATWNDGGVGGVFNPNATTLTASYTAPAAYFGNITLTLTTNDPDLTGPCSAVSDNMLITVNQAATLNAGIDQIICQDNTATLAGIMGGSTTVVSWTASPAVGAFTPDANTLNAVFTPPVGFHGIITLTLTSNDPDNAGPCPSVNDFMLLTVNQAATVDANLDQTICQGTSVTLSGSTGGSTTAATWSSSIPGGTFVPNATTLTAIYTPPAIFFGNFTLTLTSNDPDLLGPCPSVQDAMIVTVNQAATADAGLDAVICQGGSYVLNGILGGSAISGSWAASVPGGTFTPDNLTLNSIYSPINTYSGAVILTLTTNDPDGAPGPCQSVNNTMILDVNHAATIDAGLDETICQGSCALLNAIIGGAATTATWTDGGIGGTFNPSATTLNASYCPPAAFSGIVTLKVTTNDPDGIGPCTTVKDSLQITVHMAPVVNAGPNQVICQDNTAQLAASMSGSTTKVFWSANPLGGVFSPDINTLAATFTPPVGYHGTITLTLTSNDPDGSGPCDSVSDDMVIVVNQAATVNASLDETICQGGTASLNGSLGGSATSASWTSSVSGGTFTPNANALNATYTPVASFYGNIQLTLTSNDPDGAGPCLAVNDLMILTVNQAPIVNAGIDQTSCQNSSVTLAGVLSGSAVSCSWSASPAIGTFAPSNTSLTPTYTPPANFNGTITLLITTNDPDGSGPCGSVSDNMLLVINPLATVDAGPNQTVCQGTSASLNAIVGGGASSGSWSASVPGGTFTPNANSATATYMSPAGPPPFSGVITLTYTTNDPDGTGPCLPASDFMQLTVNHAATLSVNPLPAICQGNCITLNGVIGGNATSASWTASVPGGTFTPDANTLNAIYCHPAGFSGTIMLTLTTNDPDGAGGPCPALSSTVSLTVNPLPVANAGPDQSIGYGTTTTLAGTASGCSSCSYAWTPAGLLTNATILNPVTTNLVNPPPKFALVVTNTTTGCSSIADTVKVTFFNGPLYVVATATPTHICPGDTCKIKLSANGGSTHYTYSWQPLPAPPASFTAPDSMMVHPLTTTKYYASVFDGNTTVVDSITVIVWTPPIATASSNSPVCQDSLLSLNSTPNSMTNYHWTGPNSYNVTGQTPSILHAPMAAAGQYQVIVKDVNGCSDTALTTVVVNPTPLVTNNVTASQYCAGFNTPVVNFTSNIAGASFSWTNNNTGIGLPASGSGPTLPSFLTANTGNTVQTAIIKVTAKANNCPGPQQDFYITVYPTPKVDTISNQSLCVGSSTTAVTFTSNVSGTVFTWTNTTTGIGLAGSSTGNSTGIPSFVTTNTGLTPLVGTIHVTPSANTCTGPDRIFTFTVNPLPVMTPPANQTLCLSDPSFALSGALPAGGIYSGAGVSSGTFNPLTAGVGPHIITYAYTDVNGCYNSCSFTISVNSITSGTIAADQTICSGDIPAAFTETVAATGGGTLSYNWQTGSSATGPWVDVVPPGTAATFTPPALTVDTWYHRVVNSTVNGWPCTAASNVIKITINNITAGVIGADQTICSNTIPATLTATTAAIGSGVLTYIWQSSANGSTAWTTISGATSATYTPPALTADTWYRRIVTSTLNGKLCTATSNVVQITVNNVISSSILNDETICSGSAPALFIETGVSSGDGTLTYQWEYSLTGGVPWTAIAGASATTYQATALFVDTWYRRVLTSTLNGVSCNFVSNFVKVQINNVTAGIVATSQTICSGTAPAPLTVTTAATGSGAITYIWQNAPSAAGPWTAITGATAATYPPPVLTADTWYRRIATSTVIGVQCGATSNVIAITINNITPAVIAADQTICSGTTPACFTVTTAPAGNGTLGYQWQSSPTGTLPWTNIAGATSLTYCPPALLVDTWYHLVTTNTLNTVNCTATSNDVHITINHVTAGSIAANQTICKGSIPGAFTVTTPGTGTGTLLYQWQIGTSATGPWTAIAGATSATYAPPSLTANTWYNLIVKSALNGDTCSATTGVLAITINFVTAGYIGSDTTICNNTVPPAFTVDTLATGSGALTYQWQVATTSGGVMGNIAGATSATYTPPALTADRWYQRIVTSTLNSVACTAVSNIVRVTVNHVTAGIIGTDQSICSNVIPNAFTQTTAATGSGTLSYQWQQSTVSSTGPWTIITGATSATYTSAALTSNHWYQLIVSSTLNGIACTATSNAIKVTINTITPGTITANQTICSGTAPATLVNGTAPTGAGTLSYQWQNGPSATGIWTNITGATGASYTPPVLTVDTWYRRIVTSTLATMPCSDTTNVIKITINSVTAGTIAADQTICSGGTPACLTVPVLPAGNGTLTYQWQSSLTGVGGWNNIAGATTLSYCPPALTVNTWYHLVITNTLNLIPCTATSNAIKITINNVTAGVVATNHTICKATVPAPFTTTTNATGTGTLLYQWQSGTSATGPWTNIAGANIATYAPPALSANTWYHRIVYSALNGDTCSATTSSLAITINFVTAGHIKSDTTICNNTVPPVFVVDTLATGSGALTYQWQMATSSPGTFNDITGATSATYTPPALTADRWYRRIVTSTLNGVSCTAVSNIVKVTVNHVTAGTIATNQTICSNVVPNAFTVTAAATGTGTLSYQWQQSTSSNTGPWTDISGATSATYAPPALTANHWYQVIVTSTLNGKACTANSNSVKITVNTITPGTIATNQTICSGTAPATLINGTAPTGAGTLSYQWQSGPSATGIWTNITGATGATYTPAALTVDTWYRRIVTSTITPIGCSDTTNVIKITINSVTSGTVAADQTICSGGIPNCFTVPVLPSGTGTLSYQWQSSPTGVSGWTDIAGATTLSYCPPALTTTTWYHLVVTSTLNTVACKATTAAIKVTINNVTAGVVTNNQTICYNTTPAAFTVSTAATGSNLIYQWQAGTSATGPWTNILGATTATYTPPSLTADTWYHRIVKSILNGDTCTATSNTLAISINNVTSGTVASDQTICSGAAPIGFTVTTAATGTGTLSYQWQTGACPSGPWTNIPGATLATYSAPTLTTNTGYRRITTSTLNTVPCSAYTNVICITINNVSAGTIAADQTICNGDDPVPFTAGTAATGSGTLSYQWQSAPAAAGPWTDLNGATATTYDAPSLIADKWFRRVVTSTFNGVPCTATSNILKVTINNVSSGVIAADQTICSGSAPAPFTVSAAATGAGTLTYQWQNAPNASTGWANIAGATAATYTGPSLTADTWYRRIVTSTLNGKTCTDTSNVVMITINSVTAGAVAANQTICSGSSPATFTDPTPASGTGTLTYQWQASPNGTNGWTNIAGATAFDYTSAALTATKYFRRIVTSTLNTVACNATSNNIMVTVNQPPTAYSGHDTTICRNLKLHITWATATNFSSVEWTHTGDGSFNTPTILAPTYTPGLNDITNGSCILTLTVNGIPPCGSTTHSFTLHLSDFTVAYAGPDTVLCEGIAYTLNLSTVFNATSYVWSSTGSGTFDNITLLHPTYTPSAGDALAGFVWLSMHAVNSQLYCGDSTDKMKLTIKPLPIANAGVDVQVCLGDSVHLNATGGGSYLWIPAAGLSSAYVGNPWAKPMVTTNYTVMVTLSGCSKSDNVIVTVYPLPVVDAGLDRAICRGESTELTAIGAYTYLWSSGATSQSIIITPTATGIYSVTGTDYHGCQNIDAVQVTVNQLPVIKVTPPFDYLCKDSTVTLKATGAYTYAWFPTSGLSSPIGPVVWATPLQSTIYTITGTDLNGCKNSTEVSLRVYPTPVLMLPDSAYVCDGVDFKLTAGFNDSTSYQWQDGSTNPVFTVTIPGFYWVIATNPGCSSMDTVEVRLCTKVWVPNAFTPDGNNINDIFLAYCYTPLVEFHMYIFTRWGEMVFESDDIHKGWDGEFKGSPAPMGSYIYLIKFIGQANDASNREGELKGSLNLIR